MVSVMLGIALSFPLVQVETSRSGGLVTTSFESPEGRIEVHLPSDLSSGDKISGTVVATPKGESEDQLRLNRTVLEGYVVEAGDTDVPARSGQRVSIDRLGPDLLLRLKRTDQVIAQSTLPVAPQNSKTPLFVVPRAGQIGRPFPITGCFDGNAGSTAVQFGSTESVVVAESPRQCIAVMSGAPGPTTVQTTEGSTTNSASTRAVGVSLTAPRTRLSQGESTVVTVKATGLNGLIAPIFLEIENLVPATIKMTGGNRQRIEISSMDVDPNGAATIERKIESIRTGGFVISAQLHFDVPAATVVPVPPGFKEDPNDPNAVLPDGAEVVPGDKIKPRKFPRKGSSSKQVPNDEFDDRKWQDSDTPKKSEIGDDVLAWYQYIRVISYKRSDLLFRGAEFPIYLKWRNKRCTPGHWEQIVKTTVWVGSGPNDLKKAKAVEVEGPPKRTEHYPAANDAEVAGKWEIDTNDAGRAAKDPKYPNQDKGELIDSPNRGRASMADAYSNSNPKTVARCVKNLVEFYTFWIGPGGEVCEILKWSFWVQWEIQSGDDPLRSSGMKNAKVTGECTGPTRVDKNSDEGKAAIAARESALADLKG